MDKAFVLGAGLGTRLRPLTHLLPKPLIPVFHKPLITYAFDHLMDLGVREFIVNTHHLPERYPEVFPDGQYRGALITLRHEPVLLETAGGIANIADLVGGASFIVHNGDILTDLPLASLAATHGAAGNVVTLVLRSTGPARHIAFDPERGLVTDIRGKLETGNQGTHQFTGIYAVAPEFLQYLEHGKIESVIPIFLRLIAEGKRIGGVVVDEGKWWDLGDKESYLEAHQMLDRLGPGFPGYADGLVTRPPAIEAGARIHPTARLSGLNVIASTTEVGPGAELEDCILWPGAVVGSNVRLKGEVVLPAS